MRAHFLWIFVIRVEKSSHPQSPAFDSVEIDLEACEQTTRPDSLLYLAQMRLAAEVRLVHARRSLSRS